MTAGAGVRGVAGCGAIGVADTGVDEVLGTALDVLGKEELLTPPASSKWMYSTIKSSYAGVEQSSTALSHAHPRPSLNTTSRAVRTLCLRVEDAVGLRTLRVANEHSRSAPVIELADVAELL